MSIGLLLASALSDRRRRFGAGVALGYPEHWEDWTRANTAAIVRVIQVDGADADLKRHGESARAALL